MLSDLKHRLRALITPTRVENELDDELRFHVDRQIEAYQRAGLDPDAARRQARLDFGGIDQVKEEYRDALGIRWIDDVRRDLRLAIRSLRATPLVSGVALLSLALVIGATTAIFSLLNGLMLRPLPVHAPDRLVHVTDSVLRETGETRVRAWGYPAWAELRQRTHLFEAATAWSFTRFTLETGDDNRQVEGVWADGGFFHTLGVPAAIGRTFSSGDDQPGGGPTGPVTVISHAFWHKQFGGGADVVGRSIRLDGVPFTIVGVTPPGFFGLEVGRTFDVVVPLQAEPVVRTRDSVLDSAASNFLSILARLRPGQSLDSAIAELRRSQPAIRAATVGPWSQDVVDRYLAAPFTLVPAATGYSTLRSRYLQPLLILAAIVGVVLLIGCLNVANLLLARAISRRHELSVRLALGASRARLARQVLWESFTMSAGGAGLGLVVAALSSRLLVQQLSTPNSPVFLDVSLDTRVLSFTMAVTAITTLLFGAAPAWRAARVQPMGALQAQGRSATARGRSGLMGWLVVAQVALSVVLVVSAGVFIASFRALADRRLGLQPDDVLVATLDPQRVTMAPPQRPALYERARQAALALPDVAAAAVSQLTPLGGGGFTPALQILTTAAAGRPASVQLISADGDVHGNLISPGWFDTFGTPLTAGRDFADSDRHGAPRVAIVNATFARRFFPNQDPLGQAIVIYPNTPRALPARIVGVAADAVHGSPRGSIAPTWFVPMAQFHVDGFGFSTARLSVRTWPGSQIPAKRLEDAVRTVDPRFGVAMRPLTDLVHASRARERVMAQLAGFLGGLALLLAGLGLYGVTTYAMTTRRTDIAVRVALGASPTAVMAWGLTRNAMFVGTGILTGTAISLWTSGFLGELVYGVSGREPGLLAGAALVLASIGAVASFLPIRRAVRLDPVAVLRE